MSQSNLRQPPRVLYLVNVLGSGGSERNVAMICKHIDQSRFRPEVWTLIEGGEYEHHVRGAGVPMRCLHRRRAYSVTFALRAARQIARSGADVIHAFSPAIAFYAALARRLFGAKQPMIYYEGNSRQLGGRWQKKLNCWTARQFFHYMANSPASEQCLASKVAPGEQIRVIPNGHEVGRWKANGRRDEVRQQLGIARGQHLAIFVGRLVQQKRVCDLVDAVKRLRACHEELRVIVVGSGPQEAELKRQVEQNELSGVIRFLGRRTDVPQLLMASDLFIYPSEFDGLANVVIEASLAGVPIVACDVAGVHDVVRHGEHSLLVRPRDAEQFASAIVEVLENPEESQRRAHSARQHAQQLYTMEGVLRKLYAFYEELLNEGSPN